MVTRIINDFPIVDLKDPGFICEICEEGIDGDVYKVTNGGNVIYESLCGECMEEIWCNGLEIDDTDYKWKGR